MRPPSTYRRALRLALLLAVVVAPPARAQRPAQVPATPIASFDSAWASIARTYWDASLVRGRWQAIADSLRGGLGPSPTDEQVRGAIRALIAVPQQSHFVLIPGSAAPVGGRAAKAPGNIGVEVRPLDGAVIAWRVDSEGVGYLAGIRPGDRIVQVDSFALDSVQARLRAASATEAAADRLLATFVTSRLSGGVGEDVLVHFVNAAGERRPVILERMPVEGQVSQYGNLPPFSVLAVARRLPVEGETRTVALLRFNGWFPVLSPVLDSALFASRDAVGLIIDLRGNPGGVIGMIAGISGHLLDSAASLGELRSRTGTIRFAANPRRVDRGGARVEPYAGKVAILVDEYTASTSEFFATGMQALGRARIFGTRSAGMALPAAMGRLPNGDVMMHVIADHVDPRGRRVEGVGIQPDVPTPLRLDALRAGRDTALEAALLWIATAPQ